MHTGASFVQRTYRMPKDIHVEPQKFAAELINRLEEVLRDREAEAKLEERLKRVRAVSETAAFATPWEPGGVGERGAGPENPGPLPWMGGLACFRGDWLC